MSGMMAEISSEDLKVIQQWVMQGMHKEATEALRVYMGDNPDDPNALYLMGSIYMETDFPAMALLCFSRGANLQSDNWRAWHNVGKAFDYLNQHAEAEEAFREGLKLSPNEPHLMLSLNANLVAQYKSDEAIELAEKLLRVLPEDHPGLGMARNNLGFASLQKRDFKRGWEMYESGVGKVRWRTKKIYQDEPYWDGDADAKLAVYAEQGIGDQIAGLEPVRSCPNVKYLDVDPKLERLVQRSFPDIKVYGDMMHATMPWHSQLEIDASCSMYSTHRHLRKKDGDYRKTPYLVADPQRRLQWRALLDSLGPEPKIGIAWSGGISLTQRTTRRMDLGFLKPLLRLDAHFVNLEYKDRAEEIEVAGMADKIHTWDWALQSDDYDDTAALVAELDLVVCVPTSVVHLAGALGVPAYVMVHPRPNVHYHRDGEDMAYYGCHKLFRRKSDKEWAGTVKRVVKAVREHFDMPPEKA